MSKKLTAGMESFSFHNDVVMKCRVEHYKALSRKTCKGEVGIQLHKCKNSAIGTHITLMAGKFQNSKMAVLPFSLPTMAASGER